MFQCPGQENAEMTSARTRADLTETEAREELKAGEVREKRGARQTKVKPPAESPGRRSTTELKEGGAMVEP